MRKKVVNILVVCVVVTVPVVVIQLCREEPGMPADTTPAGTLPNTRPDLDGCVVPPNIAPLNFVIEEPGTEYRVRIRASGGEGFDISARGRSVVIPIRSWRELLSASRGGMIFIDIAAAREDGSWVKYKPVQVTVAREDIDSHLAYRLLGAVFHMWGKMGIYQRNLTCYDQQPVLETRKRESPCMNCHSFARNDPGRFSLQVRSGSSSESSSGMIVVGDGTVGRAEPDPDVIPRLPAYTAWHPSGKLAAFSINRIGQFMRNTGVEMREVFDLDSDLALINFETGKSSTDAAIAAPGRMETFPNWSPDGRWLYFCSAPRTWPDGVEVPSMEDCRRVRYDLVRAPYDVATGKWGDPEILLTAEKTGRSLLEPRVSPDGRYLLFCMADHGAFPVYDPTSDVYIMDLETRLYRRLGANSDRADSWHSWSSNSRWIVFSSKRDDGLYAVPYFSYIDTDGRDHKPFPLPQRDPAMYETFLKTYNVPEFLTGPITVKQRQLVEAIDEEDSTGADKEIRGMQPWD